MEERASRKESRVEGLNRLEVESGCSPECCLFEAVVGGQLMGTKLQARLVLRKEKVASSEIRKGRGFKYYYARCADCQWCSVLSGELVSKNG